MASKKDNKKRTYELTEASTLSTGMYVPVDNSGLEEAKKFDLGQMKSDIETSIGGKVSVPSGTPEDGQVLAFDETGDAIAWKTVNEVPTSDSTDAGKFLSVGVDGTPGWVTHKGVEIFTGTYNYDRTPNDFSGMPDGNAIAAAIQDGKDVVLQLSTTSTTSSYRLTFSDETYMYYFVATGRANEIAGQYNYLPGLKMSYQGPDTPWRWIATKYVLTQPSTTNVTEQDITGGQVELNNINAITTITLTTLSALTLVTKNSTAANNFVVEIDNTNNTNDVPITIRHGNNTLKVARTGGNTVWAGSYVQLTCVGNCWVMADFA